jgi:hypothetical protein
MRWLRSVAGVFLGASYAVTNTHDWRHLLVAFGMALLGAITHITD